MASCKIDGSPPGSPPSRAAGPCRSAPACSIVDLRKLLAERFVSAPSSPLAILPTGIAPLDQTVGGLPKSGITELTATHVSSGTATISCALLHKAYRERYFIALIDGRDSFDPQPLPRAVLQHLLWVRCRNAGESVRAADLLLRDGNFPLVILDLVLTTPEELRKIPQTTWYRLQRLVEPAATAFLILTRHSMISSAQLKLTLENHWTLRDLQQDGNDARLKIQVRRAQGGRREMAG